MSFLGIFSVSAEEIQEVNQNGKFTSRFLDNSVDFVQIIPHEVCDKIFLLLTPKEVMTCCRVSASWREVINNELHWMIRCKRRGWMPDGQDPFKWNSVATHVDYYSVYEFRTSPAWYLPPIASLRISPCCIWGIYFRQCFRLQRNWRLGNYVVHQLEPPEIPNLAEISNSAACNGKFLAVGTSCGKVYVWTVTGVPELRYTVGDIRDGVEVEQVRINKDYLAVLYSSGLVRVFKFTEAFLRSEDESLEMIIQMRVWGLPVNQQEYSLFAQEMVDALIQTPTTSTATATLETEPEVTEDDTEQWIRELFRNDPWFESEYQCSDMSFILTETNLIITGYVCNCFIIWSLITKRLVKKVVFPAGVLACHKAFATSKNLYLTAKRARAQRSLGSTLVIFIFELQPPYSFQEIRSDNLTEEFRVDPMNNQRLLWLTPDSILNAVDVTTQALIFTKPAESYVDNLIVHGPYIVYHQYDGFIVTVNWKGEVLYETEAHVGLLRGLVCHNDLLIRGGDATQLYVSDIHTGKKLHTVRHQPCHITYVFVDDTKIITVAKDELATLVGYW